MNNEMIKKLNEKMEDPNFEKGIDSFFKKMKNKEIRHQKYYKIFTSENIDRIYKKHGTKEYRSRNMELLMNVMLDCASNIGYKAPTHIIDRIGGDFTSNIYILNDRILELVSGQGSFISITKFLPEDEDINEAIKYVYLTNGYTKVDFVNNVGYYNKKSNEIIISLDYSRLSWDFIMKSCRILGITEVSTDKKTTLISISDYINTLKKEEVKNE